MRDPLRPPDPAAQAKAIADAEFARKVELDDFKWLLGHLQGRRVLTRLMERTGVYRSSFNANALSMAMHEGERNIGLILVADMLEADPMGFVKLLKEFQKK